MTASDRSARALGSADWRDLARCLDLDPELFFPIGDSGPAVGPDRAGGTGLPPLRGDPGLPGLRTGAASGRRGMGRDDGGGTTHRDQVAIGSAGRFAPLLSTPGATGLDTGRYSARRKSHDKPVRCDTMRPVSPLRTAGSRTIDSVVAPTRNERPQRALAGNPPARSPVEDFRMPRRHEELPTGPYEHSISEPPSSTITAQPHESRPTGPAPQRRIDRVACQSPAHQAVTAAAVTMLVDVPATGQVAVDDMRTAQRRRLPGRASGPRRARRARPREPQRRHHDPAATGDFGRDPRGADGTRPRRPL